MDFNNSTVIGVDLGGTKVLAGRIKEEGVITQVRTKVPSKGNVQEVLDAIFFCIDQVLDETVMGIGIGVPSVVDIEKGIVYDVQNIPSWKTVHLKDILEEKYQVPVCINNDANCFAIGEKYFGKGQNFKNFAALIIGTGIAAGLVIHNKLYNGYNCGAGEFGMIPYLDHHYEHYCSGQFFNHIHNTDGQTVSQKAYNGDSKALAMFEEFGSHLGNAIKAILYALDPEVIILGGSVSKAYPLFKKSLWESINQLAYSSIPQRLTIEVSSNPDIAILGAAALYMDATNKHESSI